MANSHTCTQPVLPNCSNKRRFTNTTMLSPVHARIMRAIETGAWETWPLPQLDLQVSLFIYLLAIDSLVCRASILEEVFKRTKSRTLEVYQCENGFFIEINQKIDGLGLNSNDGSQRTSLFRFFLSPLALAALYRLYREQDTKPDYRYNSDDLLSNLNTLIKHFEGQKFSTLKVFCDAAAEFAMTHHHPELPVFLKEVTRGVTPSHAMPLISLDMHYTRKTKAKLVQAPLASVSPKPQSKTSLTKLNSHNKASPSYSDDRDPRYWSENFNEWLTTHRYANKKAEVKLLINHLNNILEETCDCPYSVSLLLQWFIKRLEQGKWKSPETPKKYFRIIGEDWLRWTLNEDLMTLDGSEMDVLCHMITLNDNEKEEKHGRLRDLILFGIEYHGLTAPDDPYYSVVDSNKYVRSLVIPPRIVTQIGHDLKESLRHDDEHTQRTLIAMYCILSRLMLRPSETVRIRIADVEMSKEGVIFIRPHGGEKLKNLSSKRQLPYGVLLLAEERAIFETYLKLRLQQAKGTHNAYLFSKSGFSNDPFSTSEIEAIFSPLISKYFGFPVPIYQFRHTGLTALTCLVLGSNDLINRFTPYSQEQSAQIRETLVGERKRDLLWGIAMVAGHQSPQTTLFSYIHCCDILLADIFMRSLQIYSDSFWLNLSGLPALKINKLKMQTNKDTASNNGLDTLIIYQALSKKMSKYTVRHSVQDTRKYSEEAIQNKPVRPSFTKCYNILKSLDNGESLTELILLSPLDEVTIRSWHEASKLVVNEYKSSHQKPRLVSKEGLLCPYYHKSDGHEINNLTNKIREIYKKDKSELTWCIEYLLNHVVNSKPYISFYNADDFKRFMNTCLKIAPAERWRLDLTLGQTTQNKLGKWQLVPGINLSVETTHSSSRESAKLYFLSMGGAQNNDKPAKSSRNIQFIFHMIKVMELARGIK